MGEILGIRGVPPGEGIAAVMTAAETEMAAGATCRMPTRPTSVLVLKDLVMGARTL